MAMPTRAARRFTYADYLTWDDDVRYELIDGVPVTMAGTSDGHQFAHQEIQGQLYNYLRGKQCRLFSHNYDVRLNYDSLDNIVVQPDILVVCDLSKLDDKSCKGAPDLVIEILSPSTSRRDKTIKHSLYEEAAVREYWIVDPKSRTVEVYILQNGVYGSSIKYSEADTIAVHVLEGCTIELCDVFVKLQT